MMSCLVIFFFKQKTAYEMRISDWSSDVCSSDLQRLARRTGLAGHRHALGQLAAARAGVTGILAVAAHADTGERRCHVGFAEAQVRGGLFDAAGTLVEVRSEEHTSELQSLMRISYAVFCLKKKKTQYQIQKGRMRSSRSK